MSLQLRGGGHQSRRLSQAPMAVKVEEPFSVCGFLVNLVCGIAFIVSVVVLVTLYLNGEFDGLLGNDDATFVPDNVTIVEVSADNITRVGSDYVALIFVSEMDPTVASAFTTAAARWSSIVAGTSINSRTFNEGDVLCDAVSLTADMTINFLTIVARVRSIDGPSNILGQARPCNLASTGVAGGSLPNFGLMDFDSADLADMVSDGTIVAVITHEMGHVLGVGTLWRGSIQGRFINLETSQSLLQNPVLNSDGSLSQSTIQPKFVGTNAISEFVSAGGSSSQNGVPVENGKTGSTLLFNPLTNGAGSIDSHWDEDFMGGELMEFRINSNANSHPLSAITIKSLQDIGYTVDTGPADSFSVGAARSANLRGNKRIYSLANDVPVNFLDLLEID